MTTFPDEAAAAYRAAFRDGLKPDPLLSVSEWADKNRRLPSSSSPEPGPWRTSRTPYLREIMDCLSPACPVTEIVFMKGAQVGGSEAGNNWIGYIIDQAPGPAMLVEPTVELAKRYSKQRIAPAISSSPALKGRVKDSRSRDSGNTILVKEYEGGLLVLTGANSAAGLRSMPVRYLFRDEIDAYPEDCEGEGDPLSLSEARTSNFGQRKKILDVSTPTDKALSKIDRRYEASDRRRYHVPCPFCKKEQWLKWGQIVFERNEAYELVGPVRYRCEYCDTLIDERYKTWMLESGRWIAEAPGPGKAAGFHLSALYSPLGWKSWADIVRRFLKAYRKRDNSLLKAWTNTDLGETWDPPSLTIDDDALLRKREQYPAPVPAGGLVLTVAVDVQGDRIEAKTKAWGKDEESWLIDRAVFRGNPETDPLPWTELGSYLEKKYQHESGVFLRILATCIDSGHATGAVYRFVKPREVNRVFAVKGLPGKGVPVIRISEKRNKAGVKLGLVGVDTCKSTIYSRLQLVDFGPGYMHFPASVDKEYFEQLTAEKKVIRKIRGKEVEEWVKIRARNEALDLEVYAYAALELLNIQDWGPLEQMIQAQAAEITRGIPAPKPRDGRRVINRGVGR